MKPLSKEQADALPAWVTVLNRCDPLDRRYLTIAAVDDIGAVHGLIRCVTHPPEFPVTPPMTFTEAYRHTVDHGPCELVADLSRVEVAS